MNAMFIVGPVGIGIVVLIIFWARKEAERMKGGK